jgi:RNA polymerase sigma-70 factor (ECF subfamily)
MIAVARPGRAQAYDAALVAAVAAGNLEALGELYDRHEPAVRRFLARLGVSKGDADDLVQLVFLEIVHAAPRFDPKLPARAWILGLASVMVRRHRRSVARAVARLVVWAGFARDQQPEPPDAGVESRESRARLERAFATISAKKREAFVLVVLEGLSGEEAARALGVPVNTIWTRLHHARRELRAALEEQQP